MYHTLSQTIQQLQKNLTVPEDRKKILQPLADYIQQKVSTASPININFICTHNSRRSHLAQVWAQVAAFHYGIGQVHCYSGGTEETALFPKIAETLSHQGFNISTISENNNPVYAIKYDDNAFPVIGFSKTYDHHFNPKNSFAAVMTCSQADGACPFIPGAEKRIPVMFEDPKLSDHTPQQTSVYLQRSEEIAREMFYVFSTISG